MDNNTWGIILTVVSTVVGIAVPIILGLWEFAFSGRKRLGYRVQMDTAGNGGTQSQYTGALQRLRQEDGTPLVDPTFVLLRVENTGVTHIDTGDYAVLDDDKVGIRVRFPGRKVTGVAVTEFSDEFLSQCFGADSGLRAHDDVLELPRVPLNRSQHYKVLAVLERADENSSENADGRAQRFGSPKIIAGVKGGFRRGRIWETKSRTRSSLWVLVLIAVLVVVNAIQLFGLISDRIAGPRDCATGRVTLTGSTAFAPVLREAADSYSGVCPGADFSLDAQGSGEGLRRLEQAGRSGGGSPALLAFSDGVNNQFPQLLPRPVAVSFFTLVVNPGAGVQDLSLSQIKRIYRGEVANWRQLDGNDVPVRLVGREVGSGTRSTFERRVLGGPEPGDESTNCRQPAPGARPGVTRCERDSTVQVLDEVARTPGAIGYSELGLASGHPNLRLVRIDGQAATPDNVAQARYPFWQTEYAYTRGEPTADSLIASFLRYLTNEVGQDIIRSHGHRPCAALQNPTLCDPSTPAPAPRAVGSPRSTP